MAVSELDWIYAQYDLFEYTRIIRELREELRNVIDVCALAYDKLIEENDEKLREQEFYIERLHICLEYEQKQNKVLTDMLHGYWNAKAPLLK